MESYLFVSKYYRLLFLETRNKYHYSLFISLKRTPEFESKKCHYAKQIHEING